MKESWIPPPRMPDALVEESTATLSAYPLFAWLCYTRQIKNAIEIGVYHGATTWMLAHTLCKPGRLISVDYKQEYLNYTATHIKNTPEFTWIPIRKNSANMDYVPYFPNRNVDLLWVDGKHTYAQVKLDLEAVMPVLSNDAILVFHDHCREKYQGVRDAVAELTGWETWSLASRVEKNEYALARRK